MTRYFVASSGITPLQLLELPPMPCTSNRTSPLPSSRYATRSPCSVMVSRFAAASPVAESGSESWPGREATAGATATAAKAAAPTNRLFMAFMAVAPIALSPLGRTVVDDHYRVRYGWRTSTSRLCSLPVTSSNRRVVRILIRTPRLRVVLQTKGSGTCAGLRGGEIHDGAPSRARSHR